MSTGTGPARPASTGADALAELEEERRFLLTSLQDLEREHAAGDLDDADYLALKDGYTARAAAVLRQIEDGRAALPAKRPPSWGRRLGWAAAAVVLAVGAGLAVARLSGQRLPGDSVSGGTADTLSSLLSQARTLQSTDPKAAIDAYQKVLDQDPANVEALTYRGWMLVRVGADAVSRGLTQGNDLVATGMTSFGKAIGLQPTYPDAYCFRGITEYRFFGDAARAKPDVDRCLASNPPAVVRQLVVNLKTEIDAAVSGASTTAGAATTAAGSPSGSPSSTG